MLSYYNPIRENSRVYSVDMVTLCGKSKPFTTVVDYPFTNLVSVHFVTDFFVHIKSFCDVAGFDWQHHENYNMLSYRDMWVCRGNVDSVVKFFYSFRNYDSSGRDCWKIQFNPNKCFPCDALVELIKWIKSCSTQFDITSMDFACDFPLSRSDVFMLKDRRKYQLVIASADDKSEYLGCRGETGFCKLYNKRLESALDYDLTRFEITYDFSGDTFDVQRMQCLMPLIACLRRQIDFETLGLTSVQRVLLFSCVEHPDFYTMLDHSNRAKLRVLIDRVCDVVSFDVSIWLKLYYIYHDLFFGKLA